MKVLGFTYMVLLCIMVMLLCVGLLLEIAPGPTRTVGDRLFGYSKRKLSKLAAANNN